jgi:GDP-4-dehydro-6-deoxy-D-mannose reductase
MRFLITGGAGFIGSHLADFFVERALGEVYLGYWSEKSLERVNHLKGKVKFLKLDVKNEAAVRKAIAKIRPDVIFHLAAQSYVTESWKKPRETLETNIIGTLNLFNAVIDEKLDPKIISVCSSSEYGLTKKEEIPIKESREFRPISPYGVSKVGQDMLSFQYHKSHNLKIIRVRFFNITGPRKTHDACSDFAKGVAEVEAGKSASLKVGNLEAIRDYTDVRDAVKALWLLYKKGEVGEVYNVCSGRGIKMGDMLRMLAGMSRKKINIVSDKNKFRIIDDPLYVGDNAKMRKLGWRPETPIEKTLKDTLDYWREKFA